MYYQEKTDKKERNLRLRNIFCLCLFVDLFYITFNLNFLKFIHIIEAGIPTDTYLFNILYVFELFVLLNYASNAWRKIEPSKVRVISINYDNFTSL